ncbi:taud/tfda taurine catabolism dioxygenase [Aspergillus steynii IBT 23096]|uniref:Taud/tfda taurine catabolism dioxygenase n=1 Tax=Aspergillus steynii IBT 23096 TaxID=1392250 RepID=A0A2I2GGN1_9EURO|nr:taud/tfda taurine catabolism dioxygenase [Aspergillus steynii IBT 23096]PLB52043.1 taud/tfda taurine catabolism dioxygenase [Aspergillus steynii IBT 23096]
MTPFFEPFDLPNSRTVHGHSFPLGLKVAPSSQAASLAETTTKIKQLAADGVIRDLLTKHGAILFRSLPIKNSTDFSEFTEAFNFKNPHQEVGLSGKRSVVEKNVKTASEVAPDKKFYYHNEYARSAHHPEIIFFYAQIVPEKGGQTPLLSSLELYDRVKTEIPEFYDELVAKGIIGQQHYPSPDDPDWREIGWNWKDSYGFTIQETDSLATQRQKVEDVLHKYLGATASWQPDGSLHVLQHLPAIRRVESTGKGTFFNGLAGTYGNAKDNGALEPPHRNSNGVGFKLPTLFGDGSPIPHVYHERLIELQDRIGFLVPWEEGDVALVNNFTVAHGRTPWEGKRRLLVSLWDDVKDYKDY